MRKMKDSGIEWIGEIPEGWNILSFQQATERMATGLNPRDNFVLTADDEFFYVTIKNFKNGKLFLDENCDKISAEAFNIIQQRSQLQKGDILFASISEEGNAYIIDANPENWNINESVFVIRPNPNRMSTKYFYYHLTDIGYYSDLRNDATGATFQSIKQNKLRKSRMVMPSLPEQIRIADYLDKKCAEIDAIIAAKEKTNELLKERRQSIIYEAVTKGLDPTVPMKDSGVEWIGTIPSTWKIRKLRYLGSCSNGISKAGEFFGSGSPFVSYGDVYKNMELPREVSGLIETTAEEQQLYSVEEGDVFFTRTSETIEEVAISSTCMQTIENATFAGFLVRFRPNTELLTKEFSKYYFRSEMHRFFFVKEMNLVTRASLSQDLLKKLPVLLPSVEEQRQIASYLDNECSNIDELIAANESTIEKLKEYRQSVIYEAVTGKIEV